MESILLPVCCQEVNSSYFIVERGFFGGIYKKKGLGLFGGITERKKCAHTYLCFGTVSAKKTSGVICTFVSASIH